MEEKTAGLVINSVSYGENDKILSVFTLEKGIISAKLKGVKKAGAKLKFASEPFCFAEFVLTGNNFKTIISASLIESFYNLRENIVSFYAGSTILEFVKKFLKEGIVSERFFMLTINCLKNVAYSEKNCLLFLVNYLVDALSFSGYALNLSGCNFCGNEITGRTFFDYNNGCFLCANCPGGGSKEINNLTYKGLKKASKLEDVENEVLIKCLKLLSFYINNKAEVELKSLEELIKLVK